MDYHEERTSIGNRVQIVEYNGVEYYRYPDSPNKTAARYFAPIRNNKRAYDLPALHRAIWEAYHGAIPEGAQIHHIDCNWDNNDISNLECVTPKQHSQLHAKAFAEERRIHMAEIRPLTREWHASAAGRIWHAEHARKQWDGRTADRELTCSECGNVFQSFFGGRGELRFCSRKCVNHYNQRTKRYEQERVCKVCGAHFSGRPVRKLTVCSLECEQHLREQEASGL